ncbi:MAG: DNA-binding protein WhiA, partial [Ruminococcaceae bacterium]|nr:DNA-binding protein WhiA [Oscillospiraceae bacterium]
SEKYVTAIDFLIDSGEINHMPRNLKETALLKRGNPQIPLEALGKMLNPPVSKSGMRHRLDKIYAYYIEKNEK